MAYKEFKKKLKEISIRKATEVLVCMDPAPSPVNDVKELAKALFSKSKKHILLTLLALISCLTSYAGDWQAFHPKDEFGDPDMSKTFYGFEFRTPDNEGYIMIVYGGGPFLLDMNYYMTAVSDVLSIRAKSRDGQIYDLKFKPYDMMSGEYVINDLESAQNFMFLLDEGNFTLSVKAEKDPYGGTATYIYKFGNEGEGIRELSYMDLGVSRVDHSHQGDPDVMTGTIGKYRITMELEAIGREEIAPNVYTLNGRYWYGTGKNGKMTLKGTENIRSNKIELVEYDPQGKRCGTFNLTRKDDPINMIFNYFEGTMTNAKGQTFKVKISQ